MADEFDITAEGFRGCRLIRVVFPASITMTTVSVAVSRYLALWDTDEPVVALNDVTRLAEIPEGAGPVILALLKRNVAEPAFQGSAWITGGNERVAAQVRALMLEAGRDPAAVVATEADAYAYLRASIDARSPAGGRGGATDPA